MKIICCVSDDMGVMFNNRRQSKDKALVERVVRLFSSPSLRMNSYSDKMFCEYSDSIRYVGSDFLLNAKDNDYCFVEGDSLLRFIKSINEVVLYRWNQVYPSDRYFDLDLSRWKMVSSEKFVGYSHESITEEVYRKL